MSEGVEMKMVKAIPRSASFTVSVDVAGRKYSMSAAMWVIYRDTSKISLLLSRLIIAVNETCTLGCSVLQVYRKIGVSKCEVNKHATMRANIEMKLVSA